MPYHFKSLTDIVFFDIRLNMSSKCRPKLFTSYQFPILGDAKNDIAHQLHSDDFRYIVDPGGMVLHLHLFFRYCLGLVYHTVFKVQLISFESLLRCSSNRNLMSLMLACLYSILETSLP